MEMSLIADFADILAALGIIVSLVFVSIEVKHHTAELRKGPRDNLLDRFIGFHEAALDIETAKVLAKGRQDYLKLEQPERLTFEAWMMQFVLGYGSAQALSAQGILNSDIRKAIDRRVEWMFVSPGARQWWQSADRVPVSTMIENGINDLIKE